MKIEVRTKILDDRAVVPKHATEFSAGADLYAVVDEPVEILPGKSYLFKTGIAVELPVGTVGLIFARSGLATKKGLAPANKVGVIDSDYRGEIRVCLYNHSGETQTVQPLERIAQMVVMPYYSAVYTVADDLDKTERDAGGFGSTGSK